MSLLQQASLIVTPNAYKEGKLYSVIPSDGSGDLSVTRATTATRVNAAGLVELVPYNLVEYSEQFDNAAWNKFGFGGALAPVVTNNAGTAPDGTLTADRVQFDCVGTTSSFRSLLGQGNLSTPIGDIFTQSLYVKAYSPSEIGKQLRVVSEGTNNSAIITITADWQRIVVNGIPAIFTSSNFNIETRGGFTTNTTADVLLWGAQLVEGTSALDYFATETRLNIPRLDYSNGSCPSILVETQRTNLLTYSEQFDNAAWIKLVSTITANTTTSPSGVSNADTLVITSGGYLLQPIYSFSAVTGQTITASIFVKNQTTNFLQFGGATPAGTDVYSIQNYNNGWYRHTVTRTFTVTAVGTVQFIIFDIVGTNFIWGAQVEEGAYATSYIPTTSASVTRNQDQISKTGISSLIGTEFTLFFDGFGSIGGEYSRYLVLKGSGGTYANFISIESNSNNFVAVNVNNASATNIFYANGAVTSGQRFKLAVRFKNNDFAFYLNGALIATSTSATVPTTSDLYLGYYTDYADNYDEINSVVIWPTSLTDDQLEILTGDSFYTYAEMAAFYNYTLQ